MKKIVLNIASHGASLSNRDVRNLNGKGTKKAHRNSAGF